MQNDPFDDDIIMNAHLMGIDPQLPFYDLNLAGSQGIPDASSIAHVTMLPASNAPTFTQPDTELPELTSYNLTEPGIDLHSPLSADPLLPDLFDYTHPYGLTIRSNNPGDLAQPDPLIRDDIDEQQTSHDLWQNDPLLPDLQHPDLTQQTHMSERPGDLALDALQTMHLDMTYQQLDDKSYPAIFMDAKGTNTTRSRHMDPLMHGLDQEEH